MITCPIHTLIHTPIHTLNRTFRTRHDHDKVIVILDLPLRIGKSPFAAAGNDVACACLALVRRDFLEKKHVKESPEYRVLAHVLGERLAFLRETAVYHNLRVSSQHNDRKKAFDEGIHFLPGLHRLNPAFGYRVEAVVRAGDLAIDGTDGVGVATKIDGGDACVTSLTSWMISGRPSARAIR